MNSKAILSPRSPVARCGAAFGNALCSVLRRCCKIFPNEIILLTPYENRSHLEIVPLGYTARQPRFKEDEEEGKIMNFRKFWIGSLFLLPMLSLAGLTAVMAQSVHPPIGGYIPQRVYDSNEK